MGSAKRRGLDVFGKQLTETHRASTNPEASSCRRKNTLDNERRSATELIERVENVYALEMQESGAEKPRIPRPQITASDITPLDAAACLLAAVVGTFITTNSSAEKWLTGVHDAASGRTGSFDVVQSALGVALRHQGDAMDFFLTREDELSSYRLFHRLFWGHDPLTTGHGVLPHNPFVLMIEQRDDKSVLKGSLQTTKHLVADTFSQQGLPLPGSSYLDYTLDNGRPWNRIIDVVQGLSQEAYGTKKQAEMLYEHLFTIRAQDFLGGMGTLAITEAYLHATQIQDPIRISQIRLVAYTMGFYSQAIIGAVRQKGVPYINYPLGAALAKEMARLLTVSNEKTCKLETTTATLSSFANQELDKHSLLKSLF